MTAVNPAVNPATVQTPPGYYPPLFAGQVPTPGRVPQQAGVPGAVAAARPTTYAPEPLTSLEGSTIVARVGGEVVLASEVLPAVYDRLAKNADKIRPGQEAEVMQMVMANALEQVVSRKVLYVAALQEVPEENIEQIESQLRDAFAETLHEKFVNKKKNSQLGDLINDADVSTRAELERHLISKGSYLAQEERAFKERNLAAYAMQGQITDPGEVTRQEMLGYYRDHIADYQNPARARWEQLMVRFSRTPRPPRRWRSDHGDGQPGLSAGRTIRPGRQVGFAGFNGT